MPAKNSLKEFVANSYYHIYNRGVEKRIIFQDEQDYAVFLSYLKTYLLPKDEKRLQSILSDESVSWRDKDKATKLLHLNNFSDSLQLISYCLMPNHFHLLIHQTEPQEIDRFMNSFGTRYSLYFNKKYKRVGKLFQGVYKAVRIVTDEQFLHLTRYIHKNPAEILASQGVALRSYTYSSYPEYLGLRKNEWVKPDNIISFFSKEGFNSYKAFVEGTKEEEETLRLIKDIILE